MLWVCRIKQCQHFDFAEMKIQRLEATYKLILIQIAIFVHVIRSDLFCFKHVRMNIVLKDFFFKLGLPEKRCYTLWEVLCAHSFEQRLGRQVSVLDQLSPLTQCFRFHHNLDRFGNHLDDLVVVYESLVNAGLRYNYLLLLIRNSRWCKTFLNHWTR